MKNAIFSFTFAILLLTTSAFAQLKGVFTDARDGKVYKTITIGTQTWMAENLAYKASSGCWAYKDDTSHIATFGYLYNWFVAKSSCPKGWHLPSDAEWKKLIQYLGGNNVAGAKLKENGTLHWISPNTGANNESGFSALPGGFLNGFNVYSGIGECGLWWSSDFHTSLQAWYYYTLVNENKIQRRRIVMTSGMAVVCVKDE